MTETKPSTQTADAVAKAGPFWNQEDAEEPASGCQFRIWMYGAGERCKSNGPFKLLRCTKEGRYFALNLCEEHGRWVANWEINLEDTHDAAVKALAEANELIKKFEANGGSLSAAFWRDEAIKNKKALDKATSSVEDIEALRLELIATLQDLKRYVPIHLFSKHQEISKRLEALHGHGAEKE